MNLAIFRHDRRICYTCDDIGFAAHGMIMALGMEGGNVLTNHQTLASYLEDH
jgi:hypothetical protein